MRFLELQLLRFGHFSDTLLEFDKSVGLHLIFGTNEAGKSTTLRAVSGLLFGIPENTNDHHRFERPELRIGARLQNNQSEQLHIIRRKGRQNTLLGADETPLDEAELQRFIGATTRELFHTMFGLSHSALLAGGDDLLQGRGELGESLFGASLGVHGIHRMRSELDKQSAAIFSPRGKNPTLNKTLTRFKEAKKTITEQTLRPRDWQDKQTELGQLEEHLQIQQQQHREATLALSRLQRLQRVLPNLHQRRVLLEQQKNLGTVRLLAADSAEQRQQAQQTLQRCELQKNKHLNEQQRCQQALEQLQIPQALLSQGEVLEELRDTLARYRAVQRDLPSVQEKLSTVLDEISAILRSLGHASDLSLNQAEQLLLTVAAQTRIRQLSQQGVKLTAELERARRDFADSEQQLQQQSRQLEQLPLLKDITPLRRLLTEINKQGDLSTQLQQMETTLGELQQRSTRLFTAITRWQGTPEELSQLVLPLADTVSRYERSYQHLENERQKLELLKETTHKQLADVNTRIDALQRQGEVPSDAALQQARASRDQYWQSLRESWQQNQNQDPQRLVEQFTMYERQVAAADHAADELRRDAERAAQYAGLVAEQERYKSESRRISESLQQLSVETGLLNEQWQQVWKSCSIEPLPPTEMKTWLERHERWLETLIQQQQQQQQVETCRARINSYHQRLQQILSALELTVEDSDFSDQLQFAELKLEQLEKIADEYQQTQRDVARLETAQNNHQQTLSYCQQTIDEWRQHWQQAVKPLGLAATATAAEADAVLSSLNQLADKLKDAQRYQLRIGQMQQYSEQFHQRVAQFCQQYASDLQTAAADEAIMVLNQRLNQGRSDLREQNELNKNLQRIKEELQELATEQSNATDILQKLMKAAAVTSLEELQQAEQRVAHYRELSSQLEHLEQQLGRENLPLAELEQQAAAVDSEALPGEIQALSLQVEHLTEQLQQYHQQKGRLENELMMMENRSGAADAALDAQTALAEIKVQVEDYVRLKLCALVLNREIERYREQSQGPLLQRAGVLFQRMTLGSFSGLHSAFDAADQLVLRCQRANGDSVGVEGLSEGSRDQLYLALRLASLELQARHSEALPLIVDDILINFDDERASVTLEILAELAEHIQILFFTHHTRLLELARQIIPDSKRQTLTLGN